MSRRVEFSPEALGDLIDLYDYIAVRDGPERAIGYIERAISTTPIVAQSFGVSRARYKARRSAPRLTDSGSRTPRRDRIASDRRHGHDPAHSLWRS